MGIRGREYIEFRALLHVGHVDIIWEFSEGLVLKCKRGRSFGHALPRESCF